MAGVRGAAERGLATLASWPALSRLAGWLGDRRLPPAVLSPLVRAYAHLFGADLAEAALPPEAYPSFGAFFTRRLREGARPIDTAPGVVVAPADAALSSIGRLPADGRLEQIKGRAYTIEALLGSAADAVSFREGVYATLYLSPGMYHRVHAPVEGRITAWRYVPGRLFPVNPLGVRCVPGLYTRNERVALFIEAEPRVALVLVGAANVGRVSLAFTDLVTHAGARAGRIVPNAPVAVRRGDEVGVFNLGSTVVLLAADPALVAPVPAGGRVRVGQALWRRA
jgi:phosphatidylserine decarboxylase